MQGVIALRPNHVVTEIRGVRITGSRYHKFQKKVWNWNWFYKRTLKRFVGMTIYVRTRNTITGETFSNDFYVHPDHTGKLRLW